MPSAGFWFVGAWPFTRLTMRLGFSLRRNAASSASGCASLALRPPSSGRAVGELLESRGGAVDDVVGFRSVISWSVGFLAG